MSNGHIKRITDADIQSSVLEIMGQNVSTTYITCPADPNKTLGIKLPFLVLIIKNLNKYFRCVLCVQQGHECCQERIRRVSTHGCRKLLAVNCTLFVPVGRLP